MNNKEYNAAVDEFADAIFRFVLKNIRNEMSARDIVQETFMKVWLKHGEVQAEKAKSYLFTTAYHCTVDWIKKESRNGDMEQVKEMPAENNQLEFDVSEILDRALDRLPEVQKTVVLLRDYEGYNYAEIAEITGLNESQVKVYIFRARQSLKIILKSRELVA